MTNDFDVSEIELSPAAARLAHLYFGKLAARDLLDQLPGHHVWYAAASAAECLQFAHEDARTLRACSSELATVAMATGRADAHFYLGLVDEWLAQLRDVRPSDVRRAAHDQGSRSSARR